MQDSECSHRIGTTIAKDIKYWNGVIICRKNLQKRI